MKSFRGSYDADDFSVNSRNSSILTVGNTLTDSYNRVAQLLRDALLKHGGDSRNHRQMVRNIFRRIDENGSGVLTSQEMKDFVKSPELDLFGNDQAHIDKFTDLLVQQIDVNRDGTVSLQELEDFLFPPKSSDDANEIGIVLDMCRKALIRIIGSSGAASTGSDDALLAEFVKLSKTPLKRGNQIETRTARKALENLVLPEIGRNMLESEIEGVLHTMDSNQDGIISSKDFKAWLFPQNNGDNHEFLVRYLTKVVEERFHGNVRVMFNSFKTYGMDSVSRADFITRMKALDSGLPRQLLNDLADALCGKTKLISFSNLIDFLDIKNLPIPSLPEGDFEEEHEDDEDYADGGGGGRHADTSAASSERRLVAEFGRQTGDEDDDSEDEEVYTVVPREDVRRPVVKPSIPMPRDGAQQQTAEEIVMEVIDSIIGQIEEEADGFPLSAAEAANGRRSMLLAMHSDANHFANSQNHVVDDDDDSSPGASIRRSRSNERENSPRSRSQDMTDLDAHLLPLRRSPSATAGGGGGGGGGRLSPRSHQSVGSLSPRSSFHPFSSQASIDNSPDPLVKRSSTASLRGLSGQLGGSMYMSMMDNLQHLPNSSPAGLKSSAAAAMASTNASFESPNHTGKFSQTADLATTTSTARGQSPITADDIEEARRLLQESRRQHGRNVSPLAKLRDERIHQQQHQHQPYDSLEDTDRSAFDGTTTLPPPPPPAYSPPPSPPRTSAVHHPFDADGGQLKHGALGYTAQQLVEFGYLKHTGRWRGFPYDSWSCCGTSEVVCPLAPKITHMSPQKSKQTLFIHSEKLTPTKTKQQLRHDQMHSIYIDDADDAAAAHGMRSKYSQQAETKKIVVKRRSPTDTQSSAATDKKSDHRSRSLRSSHEANKTPQPRQQAPVLTKFSLDPDQIFDATFQKTSSSSSSARQRPSSTSPMTRRTSSPTSRSPSTGRGTQSRQPPLLEDPHDPRNSVRIRAMPPAARASSSRGSSSAAAAAPVTQHIHHHERVIERIIVKSAPAMLRAAAPAMLPPPSLPNTTAIVHRVEESVKKSTEKVLSSYERALRELRKELEVSRNQTTNRDAKVYLTVERQQQAIEELKKHVQQNMVVLRRSIVATLEKQQKEQQKSLQEQRRLQLHMQQQQQKQLQVQQEQQSSSSAAAAAVAAAGPAAPSKRRGLSAPPTTSSRSTAAPASTTATDAPATDAAAPSPENKDDRTATAAVDETFDAVFDGDLKAYRHLMREVADLKDSPMTYVVGDHPIDDAEPSSPHHSHSPSHSRHPSPSPSSSPSRSVHSSLNATGLSTEALNTLFADDNDGAHPRRRRAGGAPRASFAPTTRSTRSVSPNQRYPSRATVAAGAPSQLANVARPQPQWNRPSLYAPRAYQSVAATVEAPKPRPTKPWIPAATHANHLFNRVAVVNYSKGHTASNPSAPSAAHRRSGSPSSPAGPPVINNLAPRGDRLTHLNRESYPEDERRRRQHHASPSPTKSLDASLGAYRPSNERRSPSKSPASSPAKATGRLDALLARHTGSSSKKPTAAAASKPAVDRAPSYHWPDISQIKPRRSYFDDDDDGGDAYGDANGDGSRRQQRYADDLDGLFDVKPTPPPRREPRRPREVIADDWKYPPRPVGSPSRRPARDNDNDDDGDAVASHRNGDRDRAKKTTAATASAATGKVIDYRLSPLDEDDLHDDLHDDDDAAVGDARDDRRRKHRSSSSSSKHQAKAKAAKAAKKQHQRDHHQPIPMQAMLDTKDEWWAKIMAEKKRREDEAYQRALQQQH